MSTQLQYFCGSAYLCPYYKDGTTNVVSVLVAKKGFQQTRDSGLAGVRQFIVNNPGQHVFSGGGIKDPKGKIKKYKTKVRNEAIETAFTEFEEETGVAFSSLTAAGGGSTPITGTVSLTYTTTAPETFNYSARAFQIGTGTSGYFCVFVDMQTSVKMNALCAYVTSNFSITVSDELADVEVLPITALPNVRDNPLSMPNISDLNAFIDTAAYDPTSLGKMYKAAITFLTPLVATKVPNPPGTPWDCLAIQTDNLITIPFAVFCFTNNVCTSVPNSLPGPVGSTAYNNWVTSRAVFFDSVVKVFGTGLARAAICAGTLYSTDSMTAQVKFGFYSALVSVAQVVWRNNASSVANAVTTEVMTMVQTAFLATNTAKTDVPMANLLTQIIGSVVVNVATIAPNTGSVQFAKPPTYFSFDNVYRFSNSWFSTMSAHAGTL